jgi:hypothetical protein
MDFLNLLLVIGFQTARVIMRCTWQIEQSPDCRSSPEADAVRRMSCSEAWLRLKCKVTRMQSSQ